MYRACTEPVSSFGIICVRVPTPGQLQYLMVQRKDSLAYVEFIRGKYSVRNHEYIKAMLSDMTHIERERIATQSFEDMWREFWHSEGRPFAKEFEGSCGRFSMLRSGYELEDASWFDLGVALSSTKSEHSEAEFGFPKGRRNINETDMRCACREFSEESGIDFNSVVMVPDVQPVQETFVGSNGVCYQIGRAHV